MAKTSLTFFLELASTTTRHRNLLGDLYLKIDNIRAASICFWNCLENNPYKFSAYIKLCDIAPDCKDFNLEKLPKDIFVDFDEDTADLSRSPNPYLPAPPSPDVTEITFLAELPPSSVVKNGCSMPDLKDDYQNPQIYL